jgi:hypothetical protein
MSTMTEHFADPEETIAAAERNASTGWEVSFVASFRERFDRWGDDTNCTAAQAEHLRKIAGEHPNEQ